MEQHIIDQVAAMGFDVWMREPKDSWLLYTDGKNIGNLSYDRSAGYNISTVHFPNTTSGTGFMIERHVGMFNKDMLSRGFITCPDWHRRDASSVRKYRDMEEYRKFNTWANYQLIAKGIT